MISALFFCLCFLFGIVPGGGMENNAGLSYIDVSFSCAPVATDLLLGGKKYPMISMRLHTERIEMALADDLAAQQAVVASWQRSKLVHHLDPADMQPPERLSGGELSAARERLGNLLPIADASLDRLYQAVGNVGCCVLLADANGVPVARRGAAGDDKTFEKWGLWLGADWSEASEGTNGIGTCIAEQRPLTIHKDEHFHAKNTGLSCTAAPVFDHMGRLAAVIDVSSCRADLTAEFTRLISMAVRDTACHIESGNFRERFSDTRIVLAKASEENASFSPDCRGVALLAVDKDDLVIGATRSARRLYRLSDGDLSRPLPLDTLAGQSTDDAKEYAMAEFRVIQQALARSNGNVSKAARAMGISRATLHRKIKRFRELS